MSYPMKQFQKILFQMLIERDIFSSYKTIFLFFIKKKKSRFISRLYKLLLPRSVYHLYGFLYYLESLFPLTYI